MNLTTLNQACEPLRQQLLSHSIYGSLGHVSAMQRFMEMHVYAVWDFMSLLKALQQRLSSISVPWVPSGDPIAARMINQIVLGEESDIDPDGHPASHFELYLQAMQQLGADTTTIRLFIEQINAGERWADAAEKAGVPNPARQFMQVTFQIIESGDLAAIAAAFTIGRENLIPGIFRGIVAGLDAEGQAHADRFLYYLDRHISLDEDEHGPLAFQILERLCDSSPNAWQSAENAARASLEVRLSLWNAIQREIELIPAEDHAASVSVG